MMQNFSQLYQSLDQTTSTNAKVAAMVSYLAGATAADAAWAVYFLSGRRIKRLIGASLLRSWLHQSSDLPEWLVEESYSSVGDLAETIALLLATPGNQGQERSLADWVEHQLLPLRGLDAEQQQQRVTRWWRELDHQQCFIINKLMTGALRVGVSQLLVARAVAEVADLPRSLVLHRMMGDWEPDETFWHALISEDRGETVSSRPYPFCLASPLEADPDTLGPIQSWLAEWKWDGIRAQLIRRQGETWLWSRGEELIGTRFPEITGAADSLPDGTVLDGEILAWGQHGVLPFSELQRRIGRKTVGRKLLSEVPCLFMAYDMMECAGMDIRATPLRQRRLQLAELVGQLREENLKISTLVDADSWAELASLRETSRERQVEGLMLKHVDAQYQTGRKRGFWWKWKVEAYTIDAVMLYAQAGHGKRANLHTDYTFGVWHGDELVPIAKAYSGLDNSEINELDKWIRRNTIERFGPVRSVPAEQVFELAFEGINASTRHKSGVAVRFPRIKRWRKDLAPGDAETLEQVKRLITPVAAEASVAEGI
ncbi:ATP-dependent DNA ligase [Granulosicoccus sp. 3-233]|uniref:ATP-dependent DNA ligase n=1 Tax=Granulosicoccus sp. 3-233 TaxID=3417969 RepID=UPI003D32FB10